MPQDQVTLTSSTRSNLLSLNRTTDLISRTQNRLSTGKEVNSAIDDALSFFTARNLNSRASDLNAIKDTINEGIQIITAATDALENVEDVLKQMKAVASSAKSTAYDDTGTRVKLALQFNELRSQIDHLTQDASYNGVNLIKSGADTLTVTFSEQQGAGTNRKLVIDGARMDAGAALTGASQPAATQSGLQLGAAGTSAAAGAWGYSVSGGSAITSGYGGAIDAAISQIDSALTTVRSQAQTFGTNASMLEIRKDFTENLVNTLESGAADLVNADLNEESANMLSLQTRQQLGTISLSIAQQSEQSVLRLF